MITDDDSKKLITDFKKVFATKDDLKKYATLDQLNGKIDSLRDEIHEDVKLQLTEFKSEVFDKLDQVIGELKTNREEREVIAYRVANHEDRLEKVEKILEVS